MVFHGYNETIIFKEELYYGTYCIIWVHVTFGSGDFYTGDWGMGINPTRNDAGWKSLHKVSGERTG